MVLHTTPHRLMFLYGRGCSVFMSRCVFQTVFPHCQFLNSAVQPSSQVPMSVLPSICGETTFFLLADFLLRQCTSNDNVCQPPECANFAHWTVVLSRLASDWLPIFLQYILGVEDLFWIQVGAVQRAVPGLGPRFVLSPPPPWQQPQPIPAHVWLSSWLWPLESALIRRHTSTQPPTSRALRSSPSLWAAVTETRPDPDPSWGWSPGKAGLHYTSLPIAATKSYWTLFHWKLPSQCQHEKHLHCQWPAVERSEPAATPGALGPPPPLHPPLTWV